MHGGLARFGGIDGTGLSTSVLAFDITRLFLGPLSRSPRGIDRIDLALAHHLFADPASPHVGILPTPWGVRAFDGPRVMRGIAHLETLWAESATAETDPQWRAVSGWLRGEAKATVVRAAPNSGYLRKGNRLAAELRATGFALGKGVRSALPKGAVYLNVGQIGLAVPMFHGWLAARPDVAAVLMLHDVIPLDHPEMVEPSSRPHHLRMVRTAAANAHGLIVTTRHARDRVSAEIARHRLDPVPTLVRGLPLPRAFTHIRLADPSLGSTRYFVACGSIEPRKNHALLFEAWRRLRDREGEPAPKLVLVGAPGWQSDAILKPLQHDPFLRETVDHVAGLSSPALARLMLGASAVLCPSLAEGFGLPLLEANALGVPTIASDIPSHREIADGGTRLLGCRDAQEWAAAIAALPAGGVRQTPKVAEAKGEHAYCLDILAFVDECARRRSGARA